MICVHFFSVQSILADKSLILIVDQIYRKRMLKFLAGEGLPQKTTRGLQWAAAIFGASCLGYLSAKTDWEGKKQLFQKDKLTDYECEDKINALIQEKRVPAVIYYYLPATKYHHIMRGHMLKYSNLYPKNAIWVMVNLTQDLQQAKEALRSIIYPDSGIRLQIRFPKQNLAVFESDEKGDLQLIKQGFGNRREVYDYNYYQQQFQAFLEQNRVLKGEDSIDITLKLTQKALFDKQLQK